MYLEFKSIKFSIMKKLIGKKYLPADNSWSVNVTSCGDLLSKAKHSGLAGNMYEDAKECIIVSNPFECITHATGVSKPIGVKTMIMVEYQKETHMVIFFEKCVLP